MLNSFMALKVENSATELCGAVAGVGSWLPVTPAAVWPLIALANTHMVGEEGINKETKQLHVTSELRRPQNLRLWRGISSTDAL